MTHQATDINNLQQLIVKISANKFSREIQDETKLIVESMNQESEIGKQANALLSANGHDLYVNSRVNKQRKSALENAIKESKILITKMLNKGEE